MKSRLEDLFHSSFIFNNEASLSELSNVKNIRKNKYKEAIYTCKCLLGSESCRRYGYYWYEIQKTISFKKINGSLKTLGFDQIMRYDFEFRRFNSTNNDS